MTEELLSFESQELLFIYSYLLYLYYLYIIIYYLYIIYCKNCKLKYIGETSRNLHVRLKEPKRDIRIGNLNNALF